MVSLEVKGGLTAATEVAREVTIEVAGVAIEVTIEVEEVAEVTEVTTEVAEVAEVAIEVTEVTEVAEVAIEVDVEEVAEVVMTQRQATLPTRQSKPKIDNSEDPTIET